MHLGMHVGQPVIIISVSQPIKRAALFLPLIGVQFHTLARQSNMVCISHSMQELNYLHHPILIHSIHWVPCGPRTDVSMGVSVTSNCVSVKIGGDQCRTGDAEWVRFRVWNVRSLRGREENLVK